VWSDGKSDKGKDKGTPQSELTSCDANGVNRFTALVSTRAFISRQPQVKFPHTQLPIPSEKERQETDVFEEMEGGLRFRVNHVAFAALSCNTCVC